MGLQISQPDESLDESSIPMDFQNDDSEMLLDSSSVSPEQLIQQNMDELDNSDHKVSQNDTLIAELTAKITELEDKLANNETTINEYKQKVDDLNTQLANKSVKISELESELTAKANEVDQNKSQETDLAKLKM